MENLHVIPTDNPSRLRYNLSNVLVLTKEPYRDYSKQVNQNIYITDGSEIKEGDWILDNILANKKPIKVTKELLEDGLLKEDKKIILTTDQDLIKDGVQAIDDEFLEWFVKNPSCEEVKWSAYPISPNGNIVATNRPYPFEGLISNFKIEYKIIIPKEEPNPFELPKTLPDDVFYESLEPKQEIVEEREPYWDLVDKKAEQNNSIDLDAYAKGVLDGVKWQAERMYSEEDMRQAFIAGGNSLIEEDDDYGTEYDAYMEDWFKQFKKK